MSAELQIDATVCVWNYKHNEPRISKLKLRDYACHQEHQLDTINESTCNSKYW